MIGTIGPTVGVEGWSAQPTSATMTLYFPTAPRKDSNRLGYDLIEFGRRFDPDRGAVLRLAGSAVLIETGDLNIGCAEVGELLTSAVEMLPRVVAAFTGSTVEARFDLCPGGNPLKPDVSD